MATWIPTTGIPSKMRLDDIPIVDLDVHLLEDLDDLATYCDPPWRRVIEERQPIPPFGGGYRLFPNFPGQWDPRRPVSITAETMRGDLDALSIDLAVLFPESCLGLARQPDPAYAMAVARAYNRWIMDRYLTRERGFYGGILAAPQDPDLHDDIFVATKPGRRGPPRRSRSFPASLSVSRMLSVSPWSPVAPVSPVLPVAPVSPVYPVFP